MLSFLIYIGAFSDLFDIAFAVISEYGWQYLSISCSGGSMSEHKISFRRRIDSYMFRNFIPRSISEEENSLFI